ncbi:MAG: phosphotransferase [Anaerolineae bacterium]|nr:phosphotransferase [Anaerolineae bacterium]
MTGGHYAQVYEWHQAGQDFVLKIAPQADENDLLSMHAMLEWLAYLAAYNAPIVRPVYSQQRNLIETIQKDGRTYLISASEEISGVRAEVLPPKAWDAPLIQQLGRVLGHCHALAETYVPRIPAFVRPQWDQTTNCFNPIDALATAETFLLEKRAQVLHTIQSLPKDRDSHGLAHLDIHFANFIVDTEQGEIVLIDFDDCAYGWYVMDIAMLLFDVLVVYADQKRDVLRRRFLKALLDGYRQEKPLSAFWVNQLPAFLKLLEIGVFAMVAPGYDLATCQDKWVNTFMAGRERRIREDVPYLDLAGRSTS